MQCGSCQFENMPGTRNCARCGSVVELGTQEIDVHPPRARRWVKPARKLVHRRNVLAHRVDEALQGLGTSSSPGDGYIPAGLMLRLLIPGLPQFYLRRPIRGRIFFAAYVTALLLALVFVGTTFGNLALGLAFSIHAGSISDAVTTPGRRIAASILTGLCVYVALGLLLYLPAIMLMSRATVCYTIRLPVPGFEPGDVLLVKRFNYPQRGQLVVSDRPYSQLPVADHRFYQIGGPSIERVLATPGDVVESRSGSLLVNDNPVAYRPLAISKLPDFKLTVPPDRCLLWPARVEAAGDLWQQAALVPVNEISGAVYLRTFPWSRFGTVR